MEGIPDPMPVKCSNHNLTPKNRFFYLFNILQIDDPDQTLQ